jgi:hypothetical protein
MIFRVNMQILRQPSHPAALLPPVDISGYSHFFGFERLPANG